MNAALLAIGAVVLALLTTMGSTLMSVNSAAGRQLSRLGTTLVVEIASARLTEALDVPQDAGAGGAKVEWPSDVSPWLTCGAYASNSGPVELCALSTVQFATVKLAESVFVCPVAASRAGMDATVVAGKQDAFYKADPSLAQAPTRPVAFIIESNPEKFKGAPTAEASAVSTACDALAVSTLLPVAGGAAGSLAGANSATGLPAATVAALKATGVRSWKVLTVGEGLQTKGSRHVREPVATRSDLTAFTAATGALVGDLRLVKDVGILMRFDGLGWYSTFAPAPTVTQPYDFSWRGNDKSYPWWPGPVSGLDVFLPLPETILPDGTVVPPFKVGVYGARYMLSSAGNTLTHDGFRNYASIGYVEPALATGYTQQQAKAACESVGEKLPTLNQWLALAQRAAQHPDNWDSGKVGAGAMRGGVDSGSSGPVVASRDFGDSYFGLSTADFGNSRTFRIQGGTVGGGLFNGAFASWSGVPATLWDLGGNVAEWLDWTPDVGSLPQGDGSRDYCAWGTVCGSALLEQIVPVNQRPAYKGVPGGWLKSTDAKSNLATNNISGIDGCVGACTKTVAVAVGGSVQSGAAGVYTFDTRWGRSYASPLIGFRCVDQLPCSNLYNCMPTATNP